MTSSARFPPPVGAGDRIGVAALSGPVEQQALEAGVEALRELGFEPVLAANVLSRERFFAGSDDERLAGFHELVADESIGAIMFARGGHGILSLLSRLDWDLLLRRPRAYVGYSDLTPLLNLIVERAGYVALHGPMVAVDLARGLATDERDSLLAALAGERPRAVPVAGWGAPTEGKLVGGCLSLLSALAGTRFQPAFADRVLFWEDVDEPLYRIDRMLTQLHLSGSLRGIKGMVMGRLDLREDEADESLLAGLLEAWSRELSCPVVYGVDSGHGAPNLTLPLGLESRVDPERGELTFPLEEGRR